VKKRRVGLLVLALFLAADQALRVGPLADGMFLGHWVAPFDPPVFNALQRAQLARLDALIDGDEKARAQSIFDAELGWCPRPGQELGPAVHDARGCRVGARPQAFERVDGVQRVAAFGCSFTYGAEVRGEETWLAVLDEALPAYEFANLGVPGFGADQAYLRYLRDGRALEADEVWFGLLPEAALRITTLYPPGYQHWSPMVVFKPRFELRDGGELELIPAPTRSPEDIRALLGDQRAFVDALGAHDFWVRRTRAAFAPAGSSPWHWSGLARLVLSWRESGARSPEPWLEDQESEFYRLLRAIVVRMRRDVESDGARFRVLVLPSRPDLASLAERGQPYWRPLADDLAQSGIDVLDLTAAVQAENALSDDRCWMHDGHYSAEVNRAVARAIQTAWFPGG